MYWDQRPLNGCVCVNNVSAFGSSDECILTPLVSVLPPKAVLCTQLACIISDEPLKHLFECCLFHGNFW